MGTRNFGEVAAEDVNEGMTWAESKGWPVQGLTDSQRRFRHRFRSILYWAEGITYSLAYILGAYSHFNGGSIWSDWQSTTIMAVSFISFLYLLPPIIEKALGLTFSFIVDILVAADILLSLVFGEMLRVYETIPFWDTILHVFAAIQLVVLGFVVALKGDRKRGQVREDSYKEELVFAFMFSVCMLVLWEMYEWACDNLFLANMQKAIPYDWQDHVLSEGNLDSTITDQQIADYYRTRAGYAYALQDTMKDLLVDALGALCGALFIKVLLHKRPSLGDNIIFVDPYEMGLALQRKEGKARRKMKRSAARFTWHSTK